MDIVYIFVEMQEKQQWGFYKIKKYSLSCRSEKVNSDGNRIL